MLLAHIAHVGCSPQGDLLRFDRGARNRGTALALEITIDPFDCCKRRVLEPCEPRAHEIVPQIREQHAESREHARTGRDNDGPDAELACDLYRMQGAGAAIGHQREVAGIETALGCDSFDRIGHRGRGDAQDSLGRRRHIHTERVCHALGERAFCSLDIEPHLAAEEPVGGKPAEHEVGIGHRRLLAAEAIAGGARRRARALRPNPQPAVLHSRDRAPAGADLENVHHRDLNWQRPLVAADQGGTARESFSLVNDAGFGRGAAHIEGDGIFQPQCPTQRLCTDDPRRRSRFQHVHAVPLGLLRLIEAASRLHDQERAGKTLAANVIIDLADVSSNDRSDIGVGGYCRTAFELAIFFR